MGASVIKMRRAVLLCAECSANIYDTKALVLGSKDPNDLRCPECGSALFTCGYCRKTADRFAKDATGEVTWNCYDGCNP